MVLTFQGLRCLRLRHYDFICTCQITQSAHLLLLYMIPKFRDDFLPGLLDILYFMNLLDYDVISNCRISISSVSDDATADDAIW